MGKIKSVEINDFRIYEGRHPFVFSNEGKISNLVVFYAPNGYGKTSFFDAVEWAVSNKIKRFEEPVIKNEIDLKDFSHWSNSETSDQVLLTNRKAYEEERTGIIKIVLENNKFIQRIVDPRKVRNEDYKVDYRGGILSGDFTDAELAGLTETNILSQDQIDTFLRFKSPEEKFNMLKGFWPEGEKATETYKYIQNYNKLLNKEWQDTYNEITRIKAEIDKILNAEAIISKINAWVTKIRSQATFEFAINPISIAINEEVYSSMISANDAYRKRIEKIIDDKEKLGVKLAQIRDDFPGYVDIANKAGKERERLAQCEVLEAMFHAKSFHEKSKRSHQAEAIPLAQLKNDLEELESKLPEYLATLAAIDDINKKSRQLLAENEKYLKNVSGYVKTNRRLTEIHTENEKVLASLKADFEKVYDNFNLLVLANNQVSEGEAALTTLAKESEELSEQITLNHRHIGSLTEIIQTNRYYELTEATRKELLVYLNNLEQAEKDITLAEARIKETNDALIKSGTFKENLERILNWGEQYILDTKATSCPLCKSEFNDLNDLINRVRLDREKVISTDQLSLDLQNARVRMAKLEEEKNDALTQINGFIDNLISQTRSAINLTQSEKNILSNKMEDTKNTVDRAKRTKASLDDFFMHLLPAGIIPTNNNIEDIKEKLHRDIELLTSKQVRLSKIILTKDGMIREAENKGIVARNGIAINDNEIELFKINVAYKRSIELMGKLTIQSATVTVDLLQKEHQTLEAKLVDLEAKMQSAEKEASESAAAIDACELKITEGDVGLVIEQSKRLVGQLAKQESDYIAEYKQYVHEEIISKEEIAKAVEDCSNLLVRLANDKESLTNFSADLEVVKDIVAKNKNESELSQLERQLPKIERALKEFDNAKEATVKYIDAGINNYFNKDTINKIYRRIEPHHNLNEIDFKPQVTDKSPTLSVKVKNETEELNAALYLSAGQVNVLSLSIFLAKAIEAGNDSVSTIFMDDPIQNLSDINILSFIDVIRSIIVTHDRQLVISTHDEKFYRLLQSKLPDDRFSACYFELGSYGKLKSSIG